MTRMITPAIIKNELEKLILAWWIAKYPTDFSYLGVLKEDDFSGWHKDLYMQLINPENKTQDDVVLKMMKLGKSEIVSWLNKLNQVGGYAENEIKDKVLDLININHFKGIDLQVKELLSRQGKTADAYLFAQELQELSQNTLDAINDAQRLEETQYVQSREWFSKLDEVKDGFTFPRLRFLDTLHFEKSHLVALNGVVKNGKTTLALALGFEQEAQGKKFAYISAEMTPKEINSKFFAYKFDISNNAFDETKYLSGIAREQIREYISKMSKEPLFRFEIHSHLTLNMVHSYVKKFAGQGMDFIVIDYYQKIQVPSKYKSREEELAFISDKLKTFALKYNVCLCVISQMNRAGFSTASAGNVAGGMGLNRDADYIFNIYKPSSMQETKGTSIIKIDGEPIHFDKHDFMLNLEFSRHTRGDGYALLNRTISGRMVPKWENFTKAMDYNYIPFTEQEAF